VIPVETVRHPGSAIIVSVPHGSGEIPGDIRRQLRIPLKSGAFDTGTREIALECAAPHATVVLAGSSRIVIDPNRYPEPSAADLEPAGAPGTDQGSDTDRLIRRFDHGQRLWKKPLTEEEIRRRVEEYHQPFHRALATEISRIRCQGKPVLLVDLHSMADDSFGFIIGDNGSRSAGRTVCLLVRRLLAESLDIDPSRIGYAGGEVWDAGRRANVSPALLSHTGGFITVNHGNPKEKVFAVQIEVSRFLYTNPRTGRILRGKFGPVLAGLERFFGTLAETWGEHGNAI